MRKLVGKMLRRAQRDAHLPEFHSKHARKRIGKLPLPLVTADRRHTRGRVAIFVTCYGTQMPQVVEDLVVVAAPQRIEVKLVERESCAACQAGAGRLQSVDRYKQDNLPVLAKAVRRLGPDDADPFLRADVPPGNPVMYPRMRRCRR